MSACGAMGPSMVAFLKEVYGRAREADKFLMLQQPALRHSWNTMVASQGNKLMHSWGFALREGVFAENK